MRKVLLDVDTGTDDATAIITAALSPDIQLEAICTVWGNREVDITTRHTLMVTELVGKKVPVYKGCSGPMVRDLLPQWKQEYEFPKTGIDENGQEFGYHDDFHLPEPKVKAEDQHAVSFYVDYLRHVKEPVTLVAVGPLTNLGHALKLDPSITKNIEEIVVMGGGIAEYNITTCSEANIWHDPEAAQIVTRCGAKVVYVPLDATHRAALPKEYIAKCEDLHTPVGDFFAEMLRERIKVYNALQPLWRKDIAPIHDALCVAYLIDPKVLVDLRHVHLDVSMDTGASQGMFLIDTRHFHAPENCYIAYSGDEKRFGKVIMDVLKLDADHRKS